MTRRIPIDIAAGWIFLVLLLALAVIGTINGELFNGDHLGKLIKEPGITGLACAILLMLAFVGLGWRFTRPLSNYPLIAIFLGGITLAAMAVTSPMAVFGVALFWVSSYTLGAMVLRPEKLSRQPVLAFTLLLSAALGGAFHVAWMSILASVPMHTPWMHLAILLLPLLLAPRLSLARLRLATAYLGKRPDLSCNFEMLAFWLICVLLGIHFIAAVNPEIGADALAMHLVIANDMALQQHWAFDFRNHVWALMPLGGDWIYAIVGMFGGEAAAQLSNYTLFLLNGALVWAFLVALLPRLPAILGALIYVSTPLLLLETGSLFIENTWTLFCFSGIAAGILGLIQRDMTYQLVGAALIGAACATKLMTFFLLPPFIAIVALGAHRQRASIIKTLLIAAGLMVLFGAAPYVRAWLMTGNPVFPFMNHIFQSPEYAAIAFDNPLFHQPTTWRTLYDITFFSSRFLESRNGALGLHYFVLLPLTIVFVRRIGWPAWSLVGITLLFVFAVFHFLAYLRYITPALPMAACAIAWMIASVQSAYVRLATAIIISVLILVPVNIALLTKATWYESWTMMSSLLWNEQRRHELVGRMIPERHVVEYLNNTAQPDQRVLWFADPYVAGSKPHILLTNWYNPGVNRRVYQVHEADDATKLMKELAIDWVVLEPNPAFNLAPIEEYLRKKASLRYEINGIRVFSLTHDQQSFGDAPAAVQH